MKEPRHAVTGERDTGRIVREIRIYFLIWETMPHLTRSLKMEFARVCLSGLTLRMQHSQLSNLQQPREKV